MYLIALDKSAYTVIKSLLNNGSGKVLSAAQGGEQADAAPGLIIYSYASIHQNDN